MTSIVQLALDGEAILLKNMRVTVSMQFQDKDQSGQTSSTAKAEQGVKGKELRIVGEVPYKSKDVLKRIFELATARDASGKLKTYRVANEVARTVNLREAGFSGTLDAPQNDGRMSWLVTFTLAEKLSVQEKLEARASAKAKAKKQTAGGSVQDAEDDDKMTWFESRVLKPINDAMGSS